MPGQTAKEVRKQIRQLRQERIEVERLVREAERLIRQAEREQEKLAAKAEDERCREARKANDSLERSMRKRAERAARGPANEIELPEALEEMNWYGRNVGRPPSPRCPCGAKTLLAARKRADENGKGAGHKETCPFYRPSKTPWRKSRSK